LWSKSIGSCGLLWVQMVLGFDFRGGGPTSFSKLWVDLAMADNYDGVVCLEGL